MDNKFKDTTENTMVKQAIAVSKEAFCQLYSMYKDKLYRYAFYRLGNPEDAEDAVSDCVMAAWQEIGSLRSPEAFGSWLFRILHGCCSRRIRDEIRNREKTENTIRNYTSSYEDPSMAVELREALDQLSEAEQEIVLLSVAGGLTSREVSEITGLTSGAVRSKLSRSLSKMRAYLT